METERIARRAAVREGYQILLHAETEVCLSHAGEQIRRYYCELSERCLSWVTEVFGERLRAAFLELEDVREKARFGTVRYRFSARCVATYGHLAVYLCESTLEGGSTDEVYRYRRMSQVWDTGEECVLPTKEIMERFLSKRPKARPPFCPDGVYPQGERVIFFRNPTRDHPFAEWCTPQRTCENKNDG